MAGREADAVTLSMAHDFAIFLWIPCTDLFSITEGYLLEFIFLEHTEAELLQDLAVSADRCTPFKMFCNKIILQFNPAEFLAYHFQVMQTH